MTDKKETKTKETKAPVEILRGRMPIALVYVIRFGETAVEKVAAQAAKFATTVGKIDDIRKLRGFPYVTESFKPTQQMVDDAIEFIKGHTAYDEQNVDTVIEELSALTIATKEEEEAFAEVRKAARAQNHKTKAGSKADAGGGNNSGKSADPLA